MRLASDLLRSLAIPLSVERLSRYGIVGTEDPDACSDTITAYCWNQEIASSLYCTLSLCEVALRNAIHDVLTASFESSEWYNSPGLLYPRQIQQIRDTRSMLQRRGKEATSGRIVSALPFGFWVTLLSRPYNDPLWKPHRSRNIREAFPGTPKQHRQRATIHQHYNDIRELRNRVAHHEPIYDDPGLMHKHDQIIEGIRWMNRDLHAFARRIDRFHTVYTTETRNYVRDTIVLHARRHAQVRRISP